MRQQGRIDTWQDARGFGFITPARMFALFIAAAALSAVTAAVALGKLPVLVLFAYVGLSFLAFLAYAFDKSAARRSRWRISERALHLFALLGGWPGALVAQQWLRHKSNKTGFQLTFWMTVVLNCGALGWLYSTTTGA